MKENPGEINFCLSKHKLQVSKGSSYWKSIMMVSDNNLFVLAL